jgi:dienelactone hydrolase
MADLPSAPLLCGGLDNQDVRIMWCNQVLRLGAVVLCLCIRFGSAAAEPAESGPGFEKISIPLIEQGKPDMSDSAVAGYLFRPAGNGPFPAVVILHGCNGLDWRQPGQVGWVLLKGYAERYARHGYVALVLDSFEPRGIGNACGKPLTVSAVRRAWDAFSAARYLGRLGSVDKGRIVLQGDSHGGWTTLVALERGRWAEPSPFVAGIAWYPSCYEAKGFTAPLLILIGENDDWTPAAPCRRMTERLQHDRAGAETVLYTFPGATHAYDFPFPPRTNFLGHNMAFDAKATEASWQAIDAFLGKFAAAAPPQR